MTQATALVLGGVKGGHNVVTRVTDGVWHAFMRM